MITSTANPKVKRLVSLKKKRKLREEEKLFITEGLRMFREVPPDRLMEVYVSESFYKKEKKLLEHVMESAGSAGITGGNGRSGGARAGVEILSDQVFSYASDTVTPQGILCLVKRKEYKISEVTEGASPFLLVLDNVQDPGNLGTIVRTAEGAGVTGILLSRDCVDIYNPKTIRSTMGAVYRMPFCYSEDILRDLEWLEEKGICTYAAHLEGEKSYDEEDYRKPCAFLIGNEGNGLRPEVAQKAREYIRIPMCGEVESLNAAVAAAVLMFEAARQRRR